MRSQLVVALFWGAFVPSVMAGCTFNAHRVFTDGTTGVTIGGTGGATGYNPFGLDAAVELISADSPEEVSPSIDANCGNVPFDVKPNPADLLIVLDKSGSMAQDASGATCRTAGCSKWSQVTAAINTVVQQTPTINWGLKFFANDNACTVTTGVAVPVGAGNEAAIAAAIAGSAPGGNTPTRAAESSAAAYMATLTDTNAKFILLATDGQPNCAATGAMGADDPAAIQSVADAATAGFSTFVVGIATGGSVADATLNDMAVNGGYPRVAGPPAYYPVSTTDDLVAALGAIKGIVMAMCTYPLAMPSNASDPSKLTVTVDGVTSIQDDPDGWHYDPGMTSITFAGNTCAQLMAGQLTNVQVLYGCKIGPVI